MENQNTVARDDQQEWQASLFDCSPCSSCMLATCLPCMLYGRTASRKRDPTLQSEDMCNTDCALFTAVQCFTGCGWLFSFFKRTEIRQQYGIKGSAWGDCCATYWCHCCSLIQQDNEVRLRQAAAAANAADGPITKAYESQQQGMYMPPSLPVNEAPEKQNPTVL
ncbi:hypothetical protein CDD82_766 [Ophiocordyceps australis]|uniref:Uncharacterized protein n=1 Tax=Ophiocordyceps australis TaxID=1399860 RepID=A0A2C5ZUD0_9HYPO|nr:hypothetical protein CDD82_766 [Ophiocordyceps australis]